MQSLIEGLYAKNGNTAVFVLCHSMLVNLFEVGNIWFLISYISGEIWSLLVLWKLWINLGKTHM